MAGTRKTRVPMVEQIRLTNECRQSANSARTVRLF